MQIVAHSQIPPTPVPYLHLGYTSATTTDRPYAGVGIYLSITLIGFGLVMAIGRYRQRGFLLTGLLLLACGISVLAFTKTYFNHGKTRYLYPPAVTRSYMRHIQMAIDQRLVDGHPVPGDLHELETELSSLPKNPAIADQYYKDGWMHPIVLRRLADPAVPYELASAGPDGQFGTEDDMVMQSQIKMEQQKPEEKPTSRRQKELP